jgi:TatD DNase family protein
MIDSHCHLADEVYANDLEPVVDRARQAGLTSALCVLDADSELEAVQAQRLRGLWPAVRFATGIHPHQAGRYSGRESEVEHIVRKAIGANDAVRAVGEMGLDYHYTFSAREVQQDVLRTQVRLARARRLPIVIHTREADEDIVRILREERAEEAGGVFHCFTGDEALARAALDLGFSISLSGIVTFPRSEALRTMAAFVPADRLLIETDSPFLAPPPHRGKRNEPAWVVRVAEVVADVRGVSADVLAQQTTDNFTRLFTPA